jgi:hypothetical protein
LGAGKFKVCCRMNSPSNYRPFQGVVWVLSYLFVYNLKTL